MNRSVNIVIPIAIALPTAQPGGCSTGPTKSRRGRRTHSEEKGASDAIPGAYGGIDSGMANRNGLVETAQALKQALAIKGPAST
ncbi:hypothetical protein [Thiocystis violacea]|uniref:hypothetical protein n=1 Tax=Thiocystis violacea TaxID=13725 RepID=UPI001903BAA9|nr:hypothetical protein [Thiocystis violacea]